MTQPCASFEWGGRCTVDLTYDDGTRLMAALVATNGASVPVAVTIAKGDGGNPQSRTLAPGATVSISIPQGVANRILLARVGPTNRMAGYRLTVSCPG